jgi:hypothetical protein
MYNRITVHEAEQERLKKEKEEKELIELIDQRIKDKVRPHYFTPDYFLYFMVFIILIIVGIIIKRTS